MTATEQLKEAVKKATEAGYSIQPGNYGLDRRIDGTFIASDGCLCPIGALILTTQPDDDSPSWEVLAAGVLEVSSDWVRGFVSGFDGETLSSAKSAKFIDGYEEGAMMAEEIKGRCSIETHEQLKTDRAEFYRCTVPMIDEAGAPVVDVYGLEYRHCPKCGSTLAVQK